MGLSSEIFNAHACTVWTPSLKFKVNEVDTIRTFVLQHLVAYFFLCVLIIIKTLRQTLTFHSFCLSEGLILIELCKGFLISQFLISQFSHIYHLTSVDKYVCENH